MNERTLITDLLVGVLYGIWLVAGFVDYLCHRGTDIAKTSGAPESRLHVAQFVVLSVGMLLATILAITPLTFTMLLIAVGACTVKDNPGAATDSSAPAADKASSADTSPPAPTPAPAAWTVSANAAGPIRVGMTADELRATAADLTPPP